MRFQRRGGRKRTWRRMAWRHRHESQGATRRWSRRWFERTPGGTRRERDALTLSGLVGSIARPRLPAARTVTLKYERNFLAAGSWRGRRAALLWTETQLGNIKKESPLCVTARALKSLVLAEATGSGVSRSFADVADVLHGCNDEFAQTCSRVKFSAAIRLKSDNQLAQMQTLG
jgi:hypothetical protein